MHVEESLSLDVNTDDKDLELFCNEPGGTQTPGQIAIWLKPEKFCTLRYSIAKNSVNQTLK